MHFDPKKVACICWGEQYYDSLSMSRGVALHGQGVAKATPKNTLFFN